MLSELPPPTNTSKRNAKAIILATDALEQAEFALQRAKRNFNDAMAEARSQGADDWNAMNRLLRSFEIDETDEDRG